MPRGTSQADLTSISDKSKVATAQHVLGRYDLKDASRAEQALRLALRERSRSEAISVVRLYSPPPWLSVLGSGVLFVSCVPRLRLRFAPHAHVVSLQTHVIAGIQRA